MIHEPQTTTLTATIARLADDVQSMARPAASAVEAPSTSIDAIALGVALASGAGDATSLSEAAALSFAFGSEAATPTSSAASAASAAQALSNNTSGGGAALSTRTAQANSAATQGLKATVATTASAQAPANLARAVVDRMEGAALRALAADITSRSSAQSRAGATQLGAATAEPTTNAAAALASPFPPVDLATWTTLQSRRTSTPNTGDAREPRVISVPERDPSGRRYSDAERRRLAVLGVDPRRGFAPEAEVALAAEQRWGMSFVRSADEQYDFDDAAGLHWTVFAPRSTRMLAATLRALSTGSGVLVLTGSLAPRERGEFLNLCARSARAPHPVLVVDAPLEG